MTVQLEPSAYALLAQLEQAGALTPTGLTLTDPNLPRPQAEAVGTLLGAMHKSVQFAIGDWLIFIENVYPDEWSQMSELLGLSEDKRREYRRVSARVPRSVRRANVDWSQHRAVAVLPPPEQKQWLKRVEEERMSHHALRDELRNGHEPIEQKACRCCGRDF